MTERRRLREFLLGGFATDEAEALEERMFAEDALCMELAEEREALVEEYASGSLTGEDLVRFERQTSLSPELAQEVVDLRRLQTLLERRREARGSDIAERHFFRRALPVAMAACILGLAVLSLVQWRDGRLLRAELVHRADLPQADVKALPARPGGNEGVIFLAAGAVRGPGDVALVDIAPDASLVHLQIELPAAEANAKSWTIEVGRDGQEIVRFDTVFARLAGSVSYLPVYIAADALPEGTYSVRVRPSGSAQIDEIRSFKVTRAPASRVRDTSRTK